MSGPLTINWTIETHNRVYGAIGAECCLPDALLVLIYPIDYSGRRELCETVVADSKLATKLSISMSGGFASSSHSLLRLN